MLVMEQRIVNQLVEHARKAAPIEACGFLAEKNGVVCLSLALSNIEESPEHFSLDPKEQFSALKKIRNEGMNHCGIYHSHPKNSTYPSHEDIRLAFDSAMSYVIISLATTPPDIRSYKIIDGKAIAEEIIISSE